jgi:hypothetical protein
VNLEQARDYHLTWGRYAGWSCAEVAGTRPGRTFLASLAGTGTGGDTATAAGLVLRSLRRDRRDHDQPRIAAGMVSRE